MNSLLIQSHRLPGNVLRVIDLNLHIIEYKKAMDAHTVMVMPRKPKRVTITWPKNADLSGLGLNSLIMFAPRLNGSAVGDMFGQQAIILSNKDMDATTAPSIHYQKQKKTIISSLKNAGSSGLVLNSLRTYECQLSGCVIRAINLQPVIHLFNKASVAAIALIICQRLRKITTTWPKNVVLSGLEPNFLRIPKHQPNGSADGGMSG